MEWAGPHKARGSGHHADSLGQPQIQSLGQSSEARPCALPWCGGLETGRLDAGKQGRWPVCRGSPICEGVATSPRAAVTGPPPWQSGSHRLSTCCRSCHSDVSPTQSPRGLVLPPPSLEARGGFGSDMGEEEVWPLGASGAGCAALDPTPTPLLSCHRSRGVPPPPCQACD